MAGVPLMTDVSALAESLIMDVREGYWYYSAIESNSTKIPLTPGKGNTVHMPYVNDFEVADLPDGATNNQMQTLSATDWTISAYVVTGQVGISKVQEYNSRESVMNIVSKRIEGAMRKRRAKDGLGLASSFVGTTICGSGTTLTYGHLSALHTNLTTASGRKAQDGSKITAVIHGRALHPVLRNLAGFGGAAGINTYPIPVGPSADAMKMKRNTQSPVLTINGEMDVYAENFITVSSNNMTGMGFFQDGVIFVPVEEPEFVIHDKVQGFYGIVVDLFARFGWGIGPFQEDGLPVVAAAAAATS